MTPPRLAIVARQRPGPHDAGPHDAGPHGPGPHGPGPHDADDIDPGLVEAPGTVDFGAVRIPVPESGTVTAERGEDGRMEAVHISLPEGRLSVSALAAPRSSRLWPDLAAEIDVSLREGGARVRSFQGVWGRELHATSGAATSVFVGVDGARWMLYGVATGPTRDAAPLLEELRLMVRNTIVVRGRSPYPVRTVLPLEVPAHLAQAAPTVVVRAVTPAAERPGASGVTGTTAVPVVPPAPADRGARPELSEATAAIPVRTGRPGSVRDAGGFPASRPRPGTPPLPVPPPADPALPVPPPAGAPPAVAPLRAPDQPHRDARAGLPVRTPPTDPASGRPRAALPAARRSEGGSGDRAVIPPRAGPPAPEPAALGRRRPPEPTTGHPMTGSYPVGGVPAVLRRGRHAAPEPAAAHAPSTRPAAGTGTDPVTEPLPLVRPAAPSAGRHRRRE